MRRWSINTRTPVLPRGLFAEDFDRPGAVPDVASRVVDGPQLPQAVVPLDEHNSKCVRAWAEGQQAGVVAARADQGAKLLAILTHLDEQIIEMREAWMREARATADAMAGLLCASLAAAFPTLCARHGAAEMQVILAEILPGLTHEPEMALRIAPANAAAITRFLDGMEPIATRVQLLADDAMTETDFRLEWSRGEARRDIADIWARIEAILAPQGLLPTLAQATEREKESTNVD